MFIDFDYIVRTYRHHGRFHACATVDAEWYGIARTFGTNVNKMKQIARLLDREPDLTNEDFARLLCANLTYPWALEEENENRKGQYARAQRERKEWAEKYGEKMDVNSAVFFANLD